MSVPIVWLGSLFFSANSTSGTNENGMVFRIFKEYESLKYSAKASPVSIPSGKCCPSCSIEVGPLLFPVSA